METFVLFERQSDGTYKRSGELPKGTRFATLTYPGCTGRVIVKRVKEWEDVLARGPLTKEWYKMIAAEAPHKMSDETKAKLREFNARKKEQATETPEEHTDA
jgi:hypothetical protein